MDAHMEGSLVKEHNIYTHIQGTRKNTELHRLTGVLRCNAIFAVLSYRKARQEIHENTLQVYIHESKRCDIKQ